MRTPAPCPRSGLSGVTPPMTKHLVSTTLSELSILSVESIAKMPAGSTPSNVQSSRPIQPSLSVIVHCSAVSASTPKPRRTTRWTAVVFRTSNPEVNRTTSVSSAVTVNDLPSTLNPA